MKKTEDGPGMNGETQQETCNERPSRLAPLLCVLYTGGIAESIAFHL